jgi:hypothetical protein
MKKLVFRTDAMGKLHKVLIIKLCSGFCSTESTAVHLLNPNKIISTPKGKFHLLLGTLLWIIIKLCIRKEEVTIDGIENKNYST